MASASTRCARRCRVWRPTGWSSPKARRALRCCRSRIEDLREITEMRQLLECHALGQSIANADLDWEARVVGAYHKLSKVEALVEGEPDGYGEAWERYNQEFHEALISNCRSRWLRLYLSARCTITVSAIACCR